MNNEIHYICYEEALEVYRKMIDASGGGFVGVRDEGGILATLDSIQNDDYYPTFTKKLSSLVFRFCSGHYFNDGNKRIALTLGAYFLHKNNYQWEACIFHAPVRSNRISCCRFAYFPRYAFTNNGIIHVRTGL